MEIDYQQIMRKMIFAFVLMMMFSCNEYIDRPENLIPKDKMAQIIADLSINDQVIYLYPGTNLESGTRFILKSHKVENKDFVESYRYYLVKDKMTDIVEEAQKIIIEKDPKSEKKIKGTMEEELKEVPKLERPAR